MVFLWILICLARPFVLWKALLIGGMIGIVLLAFLLPVGRRFFDFELTAEFAGWSLLIGAVGAVLVEIVYRTFGKPQASVTERGPRSGTVDDGPATVKGRYR